MSYTDALSELKIVPELAGPVSVSMCRRGQSWKHYHYPTPILYSPQHPVSSWGCLGIQCVYAALHVSDLPLTRYGQSERPLSSWSHEMKSS